MVEYDGPTVCTVKFYATLCMVDPCNTGRIIIHGYILPSKGFKPFCNQIELRITQCYEQYNLSFYDDALTRGVGMKSTNSGGASFFPRKPHLLFFFRCICFVTETKVISLLLPCPVKIFLL